MVTTLAASLCFFFRDSIELNRLVRCTLSWIPMKTKRGRSNIGWSPIFGCNSIRKYDNHPKSDIQAVPMQISNFKPQYQHSNSAQVIFVSIPILEVFAPWNLIPPSLVVCYFATTFWANMGLEPQQESIVVLVQLLSPNITMYVLRQSIYLMFQGHIVDTPNSINNILILPQIKIPA